MGLKVTGMDEILQMFSEMDKKARNELGNKALELGADVAKNGIVENENTPELTRELKKSIDREDVEGNNTKKKIKVSNSKASDEVKRYFYYQNNGTRHMVGKKFMEIGFDESVDKATKVIQDTLIEELLK